MYSFVRRRSVLLFVITLAVVLLVSLVCWRQSANNQARIRYAIEQTGGLAYYDYEIDEAGERIVDAPLPGPSLVREALGIDYVANLVRIHFLYGQANDRALELIGGLRRLRFLDGLGPNVTDKGVANIKEFPRLERLGLREAKVTDQGISHLASLEHLRELDLTETKVTGACLQQLRKSRNLRVLQLTFCSISDSSTQFLQAFAGLEELHLQGTSISDDSMDHVVSLKNLQKLNIAETEI
ncbi:MAG: hypothetical protein DWQ42_14170, partial [Planctomycetota bacterium]